MAGVMNSRRNCSWLKYGNSFNSAWEKFIKISDEFHSSMDSMMDGGVFCCCFWASLSCVNCVNLLRCRPLATSTDIQKLMLMAPTRTGELLMNAVLTRPYLQSPEVERS